ncbi:proline iminopeptidase-family hydrolase [Cystobacter fuscus]
MALATRASTSRPRTATSRARASSTTTTTSSARSAVTSPTTRSWRRCSIRSTSSRKSSRCASALGLGRDDFYLLGHSWGGILAIEYALKYQQNLKGLIISNMMASIPAYNEYAKNVLMPQMDPKVLAEVQALEAAKDYANPRYMELLVPHFYEHHVLRMPSAQWPEPASRAFSHGNQKVYVPMQGPSEMGASGILEKWDRTKDLPAITVPTLTIGGRYDTMDPKHMEWMASRCGGAATWTAPRAATCPCMTISGRTSRGSSASSRTWTRAASDRQRGQRHAGLERRSARNSASASILAGRTCAAGVTK